MVGIVRQTWQERYDMYMSLPKEELAKMLAESAKLTNPDGCAEFAPVDNHNTSTTDYVDNCFIYWL